MLAIVPASLKQCTQLTGYDPYVLRPRKSNKISHLADLQRGQIVTAHCGLKGGPVVNLTKCNLTE